MQGSVVGNEAKDCIDVDYKEDRTKGWALGDTSSNQKLFRDDLVYRHTDFAVAKKRYSQVASENRNEIEHVRSS